MIQVTPDTEMSLELLADLIAKHKAHKAMRYEPLQQAYINEYPIFRQPPKPRWKPDNRIAVNFARYIVDTMTGFFIGIPVTVSSKDERVNDYIQRLADYNFLADINSELAKISDIFGLAYEMYYVDENGQIGIVPQTPMEAFMVYDDSVLERPLYFIRYYKDANGNEVGSYSDRRIVRHFALDAGYRWTDEEKLHGFDGVPAVEFKENEERQSLFGSVLPMINAYNKAISEKANDVDYFADAYLKILGTRVEDDDIKHIRSDRIINFEPFGENYNLDVDFLQKPSADGTQENLLNRLERLIFNTSMVANINDEDFGTASGIAIRYKLWAMSALAKTKQNKFTAAFNRRYKLIFSNAISQMPRDGWVGIDYTFTLNYPANLLEETEIAKNLAGITSEETQLSVLSIVDDVQAEIDKKMKAAAGDTLGFEVG